MRAVRSATRRCDAAAVCVRVVVVRCRRGGGGGRCPHARSYSAPVRPMSFVAATRMGGASAGPPTPPLSSRRPPSYNVSPWTTPRTRSFLLSSCRRPSAGRPAAARPRSSACEVTAPLPVRNVPYADARTNLGFARAIIIVHKSYALR